MYAGQQTWLVSSVYTDSSCFISISIEESHAATWMEQCQHGGPNLNWSLDVTKGAPWQVASSHPVPQHCSDKTNTTWSSSSPLYASILAIVTVPVQSPLSLVAEKRHFSISLLLTSPAPHTCTHVDSQRLFSEVGDWIRCWHREWYAESLAKEAVMALVSTCTLRMCRTSGSTEASVKARTIDTYCSELLPSATHESGLRKTLPF